ncbi:hypothetical protein [Streptomyces sp. G-G2]|uniref:hypothetical protein n=1 Tax=Streptomyces sp. G-G2 TaxID=3046201 RepID=UPI0024BA9130|nr:hypothetical protein [Streptomyces sp. G-G2]MDJ0382693.1 hypothetical protein [Streptomyces sp. G-G2]
MTAWQFFAGAGLVAVCCPLHGPAQGHAHVDVPPPAARTDVCVPATGHPPAASPPPVRQPPRAVLPGTVAGPAGPTVRHAPPPPPAPAPRPAAAPRRAAPAPAPEPVPEPAPPVRAEPARAAALPLAGFHVRRYRPVALQRRSPNGLSTVMLLVVVTTPAVLAAAALRPRGRGRTA